MIGLELELSKLLKAIYSPRLSSYKHLIVTNYCHCPAAITPCVTGKTHKVRTFITIPRRGLRRPKVTASFRKYLNQEVYCLTVKRKSRHKIITHVETTTSSCCYSCAKYNKICPF